MKFLVILALTAILDAAALDSLLRRPVNIHASTNNDEYLLQKSSLHVVSEFQVKQNTTHLSLKDRKIDFVYCWAGEDVQQTAKDGDIMSDKIHNVEGLGFTEMRLSLHALQVNAPWFNKAYLLVNGKSKLPSWMLALVAHDPRIEMVDRCSLFPRKRDCPTKNSHACMSVVHLVPGLMEHFVYMEDDIMIVNPMKPSDLFSTEGRPQMTAKVRNIDLKWVYDEKKTIPGKDIPPDSVPARIERWSHMPMPLTITFAKALEKEFSEYFAFVRSHKTPFSCCDRKVYAYKNEHGLGEDFTRVWPAMLHLWDAGDPPMENYEPICWCRTSVSVLRKCVKKHLWERNYGPRPGQNSLTIQSCAQAPQWDAARGLVIKHLEEYSKPLEDQGQPLVPVMLTRLERDVPTMALVIIYAADLVLGIGACWVMFSTWRAVGSVPDGFLGLTTVPQFAILLAYVFFSVVHMFLQRHSGSTGYSIIAATLLVYFGKTVVSFVMFLCRANVREDLSALLAPGCARCGSLPAFILPMIPGGLLAGYDALSFLSLASLDPVTYQILVHMRIILVCFLWQLMFKHKLSGTQWLAILLFAAAGVTKGIDRSQMSEVELYRGIQIVVIQTLMSALANVSSEVLLKEMPMPADLVNTTMYLWGLIWLVIALLYKQGSGALYSELLSSAAWARLQGDSYMVGSICSLIAFGIITAYLLKMLSNIVKELSGGVVIVATCVVQVVNTTMGILGCLMAILGIGVYAADPLQHRDGEAELHTYMSPRGVPMKSPRVNHGPSADFQIIDEDTNIGADKLEDDP